MARPEISLTRPVQSDPTRVSRLVLIVAVVVLVVVAGILSVYLKPSPPTASQSIQITKVSLDQVDAPTDSAYYLLELNLSNSGQAPWEFDPAFLQLTSNGSRSYSVNGSYNATSLLGNRSVTLGKSAFGQVAFLLPGNEIPSHLRYTDSASGITLESGNVPGVSAVASRFQLNARLTINGWPVSAEGWTAKTVNGTDKWVSSIIVDGLIQNNSLVFFTGQRVAVDFWFEYLRQPVDPGTIRMTAVTNNDGFEVVSSQPSPPLVLTGWGSQTGLVMVLTVPPGQHSGQLSFSTQFST
jgi:hypothetical protein